LLMSKGFSVFTALAPETYDLICVGTDENGDKEIFKVQVKTVKIRNDREGQLVIRGANKSGVPYSKQDVDYILGVHEREDGSLRTVKLASIGRRVSKQLRKSGRS